MNASTPEVVYVSERCQVQPLKLDPPPHAMRCGETLGCYDQKNAELLASRLNAMEQWIAEVRSKCAVMEYRPSDYKLLPPYRRSPAISMERLRLTAGISN